MSSPPRSWTLGVISDTHGVMRLDALEALHGVDHIVHAGDIGSPEVLWALQGITAVTAVRGNTDQDLWSRHLPTTAVVQLGGLSFYTLHDVHGLDLDPGAAGFAAVIFGHSHQPALETRRGVLFFNPGAAGRRRFSLPLSVGLLTITDGKVRGEHVYLEV